MIPESCNPRWVIKDDGTGTEREYLRVDGLIWTKFGDPVDIFTRDVTKNHSVELTDMVCEAKRDDGITPVSSFKFDGCCILSTTDPKIQPAMTGSCVTANFSVDDITSQIRERLYEYQALTQNYAAQNENPSDEEKGDKTPMNENEKNTTVVENPETVTPPSENTVQEPDVQTAENTTSADGEGETPAAENAAENEGEGESAPTENTAPASEDEPTATENNEFTLTTVQLMDEIGTKLAEHTHPSSWDSEYMIPDFYFEDLMLETVVVRCSKTWQLMGIPYSMNGDNVVLDYENIKRMKVTYEDWDEGEVMPGTIAAFTTLTDKIAELSDSFTKAANEVSEIKPKLEAYQQERRQNPSETCYRGGQLQRHRSTWPKLLRKSLQPQANRDTPTDDSPFRCGYFYVRGLCNYISIPETSRVLSAQHSHRIRHTQQRFPESDTFTFRCLLYTSPSPRDCS